MIGDKKTLDASIREVGALGGMDEKKIAFAN
jgi:hypothetical protein